MATIQITRYLLECNGCKAIFSGSGGFNSVTEARAVAYAEGWRFPAKACANGNSSSTRTSDVCSACMPSWKPEAAVGTGGNCRTVTLAEASRLLGGEG